MGNWILSKWVIMEYVKIMAGQNKPMILSTMQHPKLTQTFWEVMCLSSQARVQGLHCTEISGSVKKKKKEY